MLMAGITKRCADFLLNWAKSADDIMTNPVLSPGEAGAALSKSAEAALKAPSVRERIGSYIRNSYLSAMSTQVVNLVSQTAQLALAPVVRAAAGRPGEAIAMLRGVSEGFTESFPRFMAGLSKRTEDFDGNQHKTFDIVKNKYGDAILTYPQRLTGALDQAFSAVLERMEYRAMLHRIESKFPDEYFAKQGTTREAFVKELDDIAMKQKDGNAAMLRYLEGKDPALRYQLENFAAFNTFRTPLGKSLLDRSGQLVAEAKNIAPELNLVVPFLRTGINIAKEAGGYIPGAGLLRVQRAKLDIKDINLKLEGGLVDNKVIVGINTRIKKAEESLSTAVFPAQIEKAQARLDKLIKRRAMLEGERTFKEEKIPEFYAQQVLGAGFMFATYGMVQQGLVTGHYSSDPATRTAQMASGIPPMSFKMGDRWVSYDRIEPFSTVMGLVVDTMNAFKEGRLKGESPSVGNIFKIVGQNFLDKTFTEGLGKAMLAVQEPDRYLESYLVSLTNPVVPAIVNQIARLEDPIRREIKDPDTANWVLNNLKSRLPGLRETLPEQVNLLGQPQQMGRGSVLTGIQVTPVEREATQAIFDNPYLRMERMDRKVGGLELTPEQYADMENRAGDQLNRVAGNLINNPGFLALSRPLQARLVKGITGEIRKAERMRTLSTLVQDPEKRSEFVLNLLTKRGLQQDIEE
jgi:hypothetical protein